MIDAHDLLTLLGTILAGTALTFVLLAVLNHVVGPPEPED